MGLKPRVSNKCVFNWLVGKRIEGVCGMSLGASWDCDAGGVIEASVPDCEQTFLRWERALLLNDISGLL
jgi:hypothetical protein